MRQRHRNLNRLRCSWASKSRSSPKHASARHVCHFQFVGHLKIKQKPDWQNCRHLKIKQKLINCLIAYCYGTIWNTMISKSKARATQKQKQSRSKSNARATQKQKQSKSNTGASKSNSKAKAKATESNNKSKLSLPLSPLSYSYPILSYPNLSYPILSYPIYPKQYMIKYKMHDSSGATHINNYIAHREWLTLPLLDFAIYVA